MITEKLAASAAGESLVAYIVTIPDSDSLVGAFVAVSLLLAVAAIAVALVVIFLLNRFRPLPSQTVTARAENKSDAFTQAASERTYDNDTGALCESLARTHRLSRRESDILALLADGKTQQEIADSLFIAPGTLRAHTSHIYEKLGVHSRQELDELFRDHVKSDCPTQDEPPTKNA